MPLTDSFSSFQLADMLLWLRAIMRHNGGANEDGIVCSHHLKKKRLCVLQDTCFAIWMSEELVARWSVWTPPTGGQQQRPTLRSPLHYAVLSARPLFSSSRSTCQCAHAARSHLRLQSAPVGCFVLISRQSSHIQLTGGGHPLTLLNWRWRR